MRRAAQPRGRQSLAATGGSPAPAPRRPRCGPGASVGSNGDGAGSGFSRRVRAESIRQGGKGGGLLHARTCAHTGVPALPPFISRFTTHLPTPVCPHPRPHTRACAHAGIPPLPPSISPLTTHHQTARLPTPTPACTHLCACRRTSTATSLCHPSPDDSTHSPSCAQRRTAQYLAVRPAAGRHSDPARRPRGLNSGPQSFFRIPLIVFVGTYLISHAGWRITHHPHMKASI
eukprot:227534-Chlamydomonas_euryale.AAC.1